MGRPPAGTTADGKPEKTSEYPKLTISIRPSTRAKLDAITAIEKRPAWQVVEDGIDLYANQMPVDDRRMIDALVKRTAQPSVKSNARRKQEKGGPVDE